MTEAVRTVEEIDAELAGRVARRATLREEREGLKLRLWPTQNEQEQHLRAIDQRIDAQTEFIEALFEERAQAKGGR